MRDVDGAVNGAARYLSQRFVNRYDAGTGQKTKVLTIILIYIYIYMFIILPCVNRYIVYTMLLDEKRLYDNKTFSYRCDRQLAYSRITRVT